MWKSEAFNALVLSKGRVLWVNVRLDFEKGNAKRLARVVLMDKRWTCTLSLNRWEREGFSFNC